MFDNLQGEWDYDDIVGELAVVAVQQCSHEDTGSRFGFAAAAAVAAAAVVVAAVAAGVAGVAAVEATD